MAVGLALLVSADPVTIQQFSDALGNCRFRMMYASKCQRRLVY